MVLSNPTGYITGENIPGLVINQAPGMGILYPFFLPSVHLEDFKAFNCKPVN
jgi:hypothetical protein